MDAPWLARTAGPGRTHRPIRGRQSSRCRGGSSRCGSTGGCSRRRGHSGRSSPHPGHRRQSPRRWFSLPQPGRQAVRKRPAHAGEVAGGGGGGPRLFAVDERRYDPAPQQMGTTRPRRSRPPSPAAATSPGASSSSPPDRRSASSARTSRCRSVRYRPADWGGDRPGGTAEAAAGQNGTPTDEAIKVATSYLKTVTSPLPKFIVLVTDGVPSCNADDPEVRRSPPSRRPQPRASRPS